MKKLLLLLLLMPSVAFAYPVDRAVATIEAYLLGFHKAWSDPHTQPHLSLDDVEFRKLHFQYWHTRRDVLGAINKYHACFGARFFLDDFLQRPRTTDYNKAIADYVYWMPAHPIVSKSNRSNRMQIATDNIAAAQILLDAINGNVAACKINLKRQNDCVKYHISKRSTLSIMQNQCK